MPDDREVPEGLEGVGDAPRLVAAGGVAALASRVPMSEFGEVPLRENLNDLAWLERTVRAHEAVLDGMLAGGVLVPMRVCTIYRGEQQVKAMLVDGATRFRETLLDLAGKAEWGVKVIADRARLEDHARSRSDAARDLAEEVASKPEGGAYLARKKLNALVRDEADALVGDAVREVHARLEEWASAAVVLPAQNPELSGYDGEMVFNGAYLVEDARFDAFAGVLAEFESQYESAGLSFHRTGPWPAYNFASGGTSAEVRR